ncbi:DNA-entry nuclease [Fructilactobacillus lindneri]|uniref:Extracellular cell surface DNA-entry nuclease n=2 Tax=Fructilactobacillus lindneri TaxID=53444 RepID=A0A0R2JQ36_9LACO|nr:DNA/RNA non-specific endonuclease [Fructilactobacillus lindneri]ANZ58390.1 DNA-entry nuclease [Fructilactobacillus lindneri]ANZ59712.1 DNA-entry nuclease [Fructilactobacillus lindneri]KRN79230.1 extracellular cell surface DNA-entry nuclease precursor [Fructilactobacillus lindneri DSM 20690 = JCM 11027]POG98506.1 DNA-entry nuclease [Fructilactobacillus lindneri]POH03894.1 DNA-entry nuclease [Fructilactobacillus lindneri]
MKISVKLGIITLASSALLITSLKAVKADDAQNPEQTATYQSLQKKQYQPGSQAYDVLNKDNPETIQKINYDTSKINFSNLDHLNRARTATAYLTKDNLGHSDGRAPQVFKPTGWYNQPKKVNGKKVFPVNRGHLIAYSCSFNLNNDGQPDPGQKGSIDNPKNLFTQTAFSNQKVMTINEQMVRNALEKNKKVIYQVTPVYVGDDLMAQGLWVQAASTDGSMHFDRYLYNVQPGLNFDYATGRSNVDPSTQVPTPINYENYHSKTYKKFNTGYQSHKHHRAFHIKGHYHL